MSYTVIPLQALPNQEFAAVLDGRTVRISVRTTDYGVFADVQYDGQPVATGRLCLDRTDLNPDRYRGLPQFLGFTDTQGSADPFFTGFGSRYLLVYGTPPPTVPASAYAPAQPPAPPTEGWGFDWGNDFGSPPT